MRLGYNSNGLQNHRLDDALRLLADHGYQAVALTADVCHLDPFRSSAGEVAAIAALLAKLRLLPVIESGARFLLDPRHKHEPTLMTRDRAARDRRLDFMARLSQLGQDLGARVVSFWTGTDHQPGADSVAWLDDGVRAACAVIRQAGLEPALEPEPGMAIATTAAFGALRQRLGAEAPAMTLDIGHLYAEWEGEVVPIVSAWAPFAVQIHLEDMRRGRHEHLPPGDGEVDFDAVLTALSVAGYAGPVCFELSRGSHRAPELVQRCQQLWQRILPGLQR